jgi:hypothetical protein
VNIWIVVAMIITVYRTLSFPPYISHIHYAAHPQYDVQRKNYIPSRPISPYPILHSKQVRHSVPCFMNIYSLPYYSFLSYPIQSLTILYHLTLSQSVLLYAILFNFILSYTACNIKYLVSLMSTRCPTQSPLDCDIFHQ